MRVLDLFSGIGGFSLGLQKSGMETVAFCELDDYCKKVLRRHWPDVPIHNDIKELNGNEYRGSVELVCGGFPCQPFSVAGERRGEEDDRALWKEMYRVIREVQPAWVFGENVTGIISMELDNVLLDLEDEGYATQAFVLPACAVDARHRRDRVFIIGHSESGQSIEGGEDVAHSGSKSGRGGAVHTRPEDKGRKTRAAGGKSVLPRSEVAQPDHAESGGTSMADSHDKRQLQSKGGQQKVGGWFSDSRKEESEAVADPNKSGVQGRSKQGVDGEVRAQPNDQHTERLSRSRVRVSNPRRKAEWKPEPDVGRVAHGIPNRVDRLKGLGNSVVPQVVEVIGRAIMEVQNEMP
jgi:DNA (cytosine-5)-methyltransferase 1